MTDDYKRRKIDQNTYQCGCRWERWPRYGDVLIECPIHAAATKADVDRFERDRLRRRPQG